MSELVKANYNHLIQAKIALKLITNDGQYQSAATALDFHALHTAIQSESYIRSESDNVQDSVRKYSPGYKKAA